MGRVAHKREKGKKQRALEKVRVLDAEPYKAMEVDARVGAIQTLIPLG